jgi:glyoxylase-like metal-dependent hydrolase (beta-lactamase superfamily II)
MRRSALFVTAAVAVAVMIVAIRGQNAPSERAALTAAAQALGGLDRVRSIRNITLEGFGQYAYQFGGANITADPNAPQKYQAANDLKRVYDLEHGRFQELERRNFLFPFAATFGHDWAQVNLILDGDIAYNKTPDGKVVRALRVDPGVLQHDGVHMRRMWMLNNPIALVRTALDPATKLSAARRENGVTVIDLTLKEGDKLSMGIAASTNLPAWVRWKHPHMDLGQVTYTTYFTGYVPFAGVLLPLAYDTRIDWRNVDYFKLYVDNYTIDGPIADLSAPQAMRDAPEPQQTVKVAATPVAKGIWRIAPGGTTVFEFADHLTLFEITGGDPQAKATIDLAKTLAPGKPVTQVITSHGHFDHVTGLRTAIAEGLTVIARRGNEILYREMATHPSPDYPDEQERKKQPLKFTPVDEHLRLSDAQMTVDVYWARNDLHMADAVFAYVPATKVWVEGDIATAAVDYQFWADNYMDNIEYYKLDVETISPVHMNIMKHAEVIEMLKAGVKRARERCAAEAAKGNYFAGCPVQTKRY